MGFIVILILLAIDILTKQWAINVLAKGNDITVIKGFFDLAYLENRGAAFGILQNKVIFLALITSIVILIMVVYLIKYKPESKILKYSFYLIISGAIGNLIDRVRLGFVVDFLQFHYKDVYYFPTFNMADTFVVIGTALMILYVVKGVE
ncbi:signal peptidase II [Clostridium amylolyticum]|uniref:Lipoprotein signal peptidase n=1 Tax=Clostridium amylolyticum TaxID=1121298 RepID=A0A1M6KJY4_9CLOT|nr:signal peptidase II [Clostridium amylolyticum]SHJ59131.1 signal peptidase II [Clostridium amylolyticum]